MRAERVRDIGVRSAMAMEVFFRALTLVSGLAARSIYGLGGYLALRGHLDAGTVVTMALLLNRLYAPLTALGTARLDVVTALVSFERVFEVLDIKPLIAEAPDAARGPRRPGVGRFRRRPLRLPVGRQGVARLARGGRRARRPRRRRGAARRLVPGRAGPDGRARRLVRRGKSTLASLVPRLYDVDAGTVRLAGVDVRDLSFDSIRGTVGVVTQDGHLFHDTIRANLRYAAPEATDADLWDALDQARLASWCGRCPTGSTPS